MQKVLGLIGYPLGHSQSPAIFQKRFQAMNLRDWEYRLFPLENIEALPSLLANTEGLIGLNVTIPHKKTVLQYMDQVDGTAAAIGAANVLFRSLEFGWTAYNTDGLALLRMLRNIRSIRKHPKALILGTGGAAMAAVWALQELGIEYKCVSRSPHLGMLTYEDLNAEHLVERTLIIQATPLGMTPAQDTCPDIPWEYVTERHLLVDLVYNPRTTLFMKKGKSRGARAINGLKMLYLQADFAWAIWSAPFI